MRRLTALLLCLLLTLSASAHHGRGAAGSSGGGGGAVQQFTFSNFTGSDSVLFQANVFPNQNPWPITPSGTSHTVGGGFYITAQSITSFTTQFTFTQATQSQVPTYPYGSAMTFTAQNVNGTTNPGCYPPAYVCVGDANVGGYGSYNPATIGAAQQPLVNAISVKFDAAGSGQWNYPTGGAPAFTGLYISGGAYSTMTPSNDLNPYGISLTAGDLMQANIVYDGTLLTMVLKDTVTSAQARYVWPVNIQTAVGATTAFVGFTGGNAPNDAAGQTVYSWTYWSGYNTRLATPTFSVTPGSYTSTQTVSITCPSGATCYYTTNGLLPTSASTQYTSALTVSSSEVINVVAIESNFTDSLVATGNYIITSGSNTINFGSGFASASNLISTVGHAVISSSKIKLTDTSSMPISGLAGEAGAAWYQAPVNVSSFSTTFQYQASTTDTGGAAFVIQNQPQSNPSPAYTIDVGGTVISGGPLAVNNYGASLGYGYLAPGGTGVGTTGGLYNSVALTFNLSNNGMGVYTGNSFPSGSDTTVTGITLGSNDPINVTVTYSSGTLSVSMTDTITSGTFSHSWSVNVPTAVGASTGYVGFTAGSNAGVVQSINNWVY